MGFLWLWVWVTTFYWGLYSGRRPGYIFSVFTGSLSGRRNGSDILWRRCSIYTTASWTGWLILDKQFLSWIFQQNHHDLSFSKIILSFTTKFFIYFRKGGDHIPFQHQPCISRYREQKWTSWGIVQGSFSLSLYLQHHFYYRTAERRRKKFHVFRNVIQNFGNTDNTYSCIFTLSQHGVISSIEYVSC